MKETSTAPQTIVMTGATSGIGGHALPILRQTGARVIVGARRDVEADAVVLPLDLESLESVREFADRTRETAGDGGIDVLILNAGAQFADTSIATVDGFERTFAVNHLAHFLLLDLLLPSVAPGGRVVITTSDTHDPALFPFAPTEVDVRTWARADAGLATMEIYAASKLANLLTSQYLAHESTSTNAGIRSFAYNPGLTGGTELQRTQPQVRDWVTSMRSDRTAGIHVGDPDHAGLVLARLALGDLRVPDDAVYVSIERGEVEFPTPSALGRDAVAAASLWETTRDLLEMH